MEGKKEVLSELMKLITECPEAVKRVVIVIEPAKLSKDESRKPK